MSKQAFFDFALKAFLFLSPIFFFKTYQLSYARGLFFILASFALFGISLGLKPKRTFSNHWLALFLIWALVRVFVGGNYSSIEQEWFNFWISTAGFIYIFAGILLFYTVYCHAEDPKDYLKPILIVCIMNLVLTTAQITGHDFVWTYPRSLGGFMGISSQLGQYSAMSIPLVFFINPYLTIIPLTTLFLSKSISSIIATATGIAIFGGFKGRVLKIKVVLGVLLVSWLLFNSGYVRARFQSRPVMWEKTLRATLERPYLGHGYLSFTDVVVKPKDVAGIGGLQYSRAHNDPLHTAQEMGIPAMIIIGGLFVALWKKFKAKQDKDKLTQLLAISILIPLINMSGQTLIRYASMAGTFIVLLAFLFIKLQGGEDGNHI